MLMLQKNILNKKKRNKYVKNLNIRLGNIHHNYNDITINDITINDITIQNDTQKSESRPQFTMSADAPVFSSNQNDIKTNIGENAPRRKTSNPSSNHNWTDIETTSHDIEKQLDYSNTNPPPTFQHVHENKINNGSHNGWIDYFSGPGTPDTT
eukprot:UN31882